jgi:predicted O-linked N-acetylglucosamine transferase (SPINDLY family)
MGESISKHVGLEDHCAYSSKDYIEICASLAHDLGQLSYLRKRLRNQVANSALCDGPTYARNFEDAIQTMWDKNNNNNKDRG